MVYLSPQLILMNLEKCFVGWMAVEKEFIKNYMNLLKVSMV